MNDFVVRKDEYVIFVEHVIERARHKVVLVAAEYGVLVIIADGIVHPAHIPLKSEAEPLVLRGSGYARNYGAVLRDNESRSALAEYGVQMTEELKAFHIEVGAVLVGAPLFPAEAVVKVGDSVSEGQIIAAVPMDKVGANIHSSINGIVESVDTEKIVINGENVK